MHEVCRIQYGESIHIFCYLFLIWVIFGELHFRFHCVFELGLSQNQTCSNLRGLIMYYNYVLWIWEGMAYGSWIYTYIVYTLWLNK